MTIYDRELISGTETMNRLRHGRTEVFWRGLIYVPGLRAGEESVQYIAREFASSGRPPFEQLRGSFAVVLCADEQTIAFADNSGLNTFYFHPKAVGTSLLETAVNLTQHGENLGFNATALAEAYAIGRILTNDTLIQDIAMLDKHSFLRIASGEIRSISKGLPDIDSPPRDFSPSKFFDDFAYAVGSEPLSCALTGGYDSRMVFAFLKSRASVTPTLSGDKPVTSDARVGAAVARAAGTTLEFLATPKPTINRESLQIAFQENDGAPGCLSDSALRLLSYYDQIAQRGPGIHVTGDGGVLHKDWEWIQDFPFYRKKSINLRKFYAQRLVFNFDVAGAGKRLQGPIATMRKRTLATLAEYVRGTNTQSYDMLYYHVNGRRTALYNPQPKGVTLYAPLMETDFVAYSYALPRKQRFFNNNIRRLTTAEDKAVAQVPTAYGMTASSESRFLVRDAFLQVIDYSKRFIRLVGRRVLGRTPLLEVTTRWSATAELRRTSEALSAVRFCQDLGLIARTESVSTLSQRHLEFAVETYLWGRLAQVRHVSAERAQL